MKPIRLISLAATFSLATVSASAEVLSVLDATLGRTEVDVAAIRDGKFLGRTPQGQIEIPLRDVLKLERFSGKVVDDQRLELVLRDGQCFSGTPGGFSDDKVKWNHPLLGGRSFPLAQVARVRRANSPENPRLSAEELTRDVLLLTNGDRTGGIVMSMDERAVTLQSLDGQTITVEWPGIDQIHLAHTGESAAPKSDWRVSLQDGTVVDVASIRFTDDGLILVWGKLELPIPLGALRSIENRAARARLLQNITPLESEYAPYFPRIGSENTFPATPEIVVGNTKTRSFLTARPYSRMTWPIEAGQKLFKTRYAVAETGPLANVQIRIWLDDRKVLDQAGLTGGSPLGTFETPLGSARTLTLEVDFGENFDVQDQFYWIEPVLISD